MNSSSETRRVSKTRERERRLFEDRQSFVSMTRDMHVQPSVGFYDTLLISQAFGSFICEIQATVKITDSLSSSTESSVKDDKPQENIVMRVQRSNDFLGN